MNIIKKFLTNNDCYKQGRKIVPKGIMVHSLGVPQPDADVIWKSWNNPDVSKCIHAFVEKDRVIQTLPWNYRGWHAGGSANNSFIGFEICEPNTFKYGHGSTMVGYDVKENQEYFDKIYNNSIELCAMLCKEYKLNPLTDIICHCEGYKKGIASNHGDILHWFPKHGKDMDDFRNDVKKLMDKTTTVKKENPINKVTTAIKNKVTKPTAYVKVLTETLNVRSNPTWDTNDVCGVVKKDDVFTVVKKVDGGFYLLKSGLYVTSNPRYVDYYEK